MENGSTFSSLTKTYSGKNYRHTAIVRHKGSVIAFAMDDQRRIYYAVLDMQAEAGDSAQTPSPLDVNNWPGTPEELAFPNEIAETGFGIADQTLLPTYQKGSQEPVKPGTILNPRDKDLFRSTTARLTAPFPFQVLSDGQFIYLFRQAIDPGHPDMVYKTDAKGELIKDKEGNYVPLVNATLLVDRFVLVGNVLSPKLEIRFQRSRSKNRPASRKDGLGAKDLDGNPFYEPTQELKFIGHLNAGRFAVLLLPTQIAEIQRWQFFAENRITRRIDTYNVERSNDGLFNTRGSQTYTCVDHPDVFAKQAGKCVEPSLYDPSATCDKDLVPRISREGYAESALQLEKPGDFVTLQPGATLGETFTQEAWLYPARTQSTEPQALITGAKADKNGAPSLWIVGQTRVKTGFGDGKKWQEFTSRSILTPETWNHLAVTFDGSSCRFYINGNLRDKIDLPEPKKAAVQSVLFFGADENGFQGILDEIRFWNRVRSAQELKTDLNQRLTGLEPGLNGYWRFDEAQGNIIYDQTNRLANGKKTGGKWVTSDAPVGENPGINRNSFHIHHAGEDRKVASGLTALLYYQQANVQSGYEGKDKPLKQNARVMLALATENVSGGNPYIATLDFGVSASGKIAQAPDLIDLSMLNPEQAGTLSVNEQLDRLSNLQGELQLLRNDISRLTQAIALTDNAITLVSNALNNPDSFSTPFADPDFNHLNPHLDTLKTAYTALRTTGAAKQALDRELSNARITVYEHHNYGGSSLTFNRGYIGYTVLNAQNFNDKISSILIPEPLQVRVYEHANAGGKSQLFPSSVPKLEGFWNERISSMDVEENADFAKKRADAAKLAENAQKNYDNARQTVRKDLDDLLQRKARLQGEKNAKEARRDALQTELNQITGLLSKGISVTMSLVHIDPFGLSISGGLLGFAWTKDAPLLFDSATGTLALYFRGTDDQFFATYYTTFTERAKYPLVDAMQNQTVICQARSTDLEMDKIILEVSGPEEAGTCTVSMAGAGIEETWTNVPRDPDRFARVLNGAAGHYENNKLVGYREYIGSGTVHLEEGRLVLDIPQGIRRSLESGAALMIGVIRMNTDEEAAAGATQIRLTGDTILLPDRSLPVYYMEYDYAANARTTKVPGDLFGGSLLLFASVVEPGQGPVTNQRVTSGSTLTSQWIADVPGSTLAFDGKTTIARLSGTSNLDRLDFQDDLTLEAWVRPTRIEGQSRIIHHQSPDSGYVLGLQKRDLESALQFNGTDTAMVVGDRIPIEAGNTPHTIEAWVRIESLPQSRSWPLLLGKPDTGAHHWIVQPSGGLQIGVFNDPNGQVTPTLPVNQWTHVAGVFDGNTLTVYFNGVKKESSPARFNLGGSSSGLPFTLGQPQSGDSFFAGQLEEVRIWKRARTPQEILADMRRRLSGKETDLAGYWHFEDERSADNSRYGNDGLLTGEIRTGASPLPAYSVFSGINNNYHQTRDIFAGGSWTHLAAVFQQAYGLKFDGRNSYLDCGKDDSLNINSDLTIEVFLQADDFFQNRGILTRGKIRDTADQQVPYELTINQSGKLVFSFEDEKGKRYSFSSQTRLQGKRPYRIAVTRKRESLNYQDSDNHYYVFGWDNISLHIDSNTPESFIHTFDNKVKDAILEAQKPNPNEARIKLVKDYPSANLRPAGTGRNGKATEIGRDASNSMFKGIISEVRIWNAGLDSSEVFQDVRSDAKGLVSWWRFEEREGTRSVDYTSQNHANFNGNIKWEKDPDPSRSKVILYVNDSDELATDPRPATDFAAASPHFAIGGLGATPVRDLFQGELEEVRIWKKARTQEQVQDSLFRRLNSEFDDLIAYYPFDAEKEKKVTDFSFRSNHLDISGTADFLLSSAPVGDDIPQVRSALAGVRTPFSDLIHSTPAVHEYGDMQYDLYGNLIGAFKRCYGFVKDGNWHLITGFKVGDLVTEWIGQVQFAPQLIGYIEGAPPAPSENLTTRAVPGIGDVDDYNEACTIELVEAEEVSYTYAASRDSGFDMEVEFVIGAVFGTGISAGIGMESKVLDVENVAGLRGRFEHALGWLEDAQTSAGRATRKRTSLELRGRFSTAEETAMEPMGRRFIPENVGQALVRSETADVYALRLKHNGALISYQMLPNPDIPKDWNIISFPINPRYIKQGTLDGKVGLRPDVDYPNALTYSPDSSYFKPIEAYTLKDRINRSETELKTHFNQYAAGSIGRRQHALHFSSGDLAAGRIVDKLPQLFKRNLVNTYVWTADGGLFAETQESMDSWQETIGGSYAFRGMGGLALDLKIKPGIKLEINALFGGHLNLTTTKTQESSTSFGMEVRLDKVERDIYLRQELADGTIEVVFDKTDPLRPKPRRVPGKVDAYRFMSFYLEPDSDHFDTFFNRIVDPIWLEQSDDPAAAALREARDEGKKPPCWRVLHRVTYISRVLPPLDDTAPPSLEKTLQTLDIDSNFELIKQLEPYVSAKLSSIPAFSDAVRETIEENLPELIPHTDEVIRYLQQYFGIMEGPAPISGAEAFGEATFLELAPNQPPIVNAGQDQTIGLDGASVSTDLDANVIDDRLEKTEAIFVTWEKMAGDGDVVFDDPHAVQTKATFTKRGRYVLRLTASDGILTSHDEVSIIVNERPVISAGPDQQVTALEATLSGRILDSGLGDPQTGILTATWSKMSPTGQADFEEKSKLSTNVTFNTRGHYLLKLTVSNGTFDADDEVMIAVAARTTEQLQALYTFEQTAGTRIPDVSGAGTPLNLNIYNPRSVQWSGNSLIVKKPVLLSTINPATRLTEAIKTSGSMTVEAWIKPQGPMEHGLGRIVSLSGGAKARNFILGQSAGQFHFGVRTSSTNANASDKALAAGSVETGKLVHLVCTRDSDGWTRLYINGEEQFSRQVQGDFSTWDANFQLSLGHEWNAGEEQDGAWLGAYHLVAVFSRALTESEIRQNFEFGPDTNLPPIVSAGPDQTINWSNGQLPIAARLEGVVAHDRLTTGTTQWIQVGGPGSPDGVEFEADSAPATLAKFSQKGRYTLRLTAEDGEMMTSDETVITVNLPPAVRLLMDSPALALTGSSASTEIGAEITDSGLGDDTGAMTFRWSRISGPETLKIDQPDQQQTAIYFTQRGVYGLILEASNGHLTTTLPFSITVNQIPVINAGKDQILRFPLPPAPVETELSATLVDTGLGYPEDTLRLTWETVSGPTAAVFADAGQAKTRVTFPASGLYVLRLTAANRDNPELSASDEARITVNRAPVVDAGADPAPALLQPEPGGPKYVPVLLDGTVSDDGLPNPPGTLTMKWTTVSGPSHVDLVPDDMDYTEARFNRKGKYVLKLEVSDGAETVIDEVAVVVNTPPNIDAGASRRVTATGNQVDVQLEGSVSDDGLGDKTPQSVFTTLWEQIKGPGHSTFADANNIKTNATFPPAKGIYELRLTAGNGFATTSRTTRVIVNQPPVVGEPLVEEVANQSRKRLLTARITDDGLGNPGQDKLTVTWKKTRGDGQVIFDPAPGDTNNSLKTQVSFVRSGDYEIEMTVDNGAGAVVKKTVSIVIRS